MQTTIDKAGRVVIPASVREKAGLKPGTPIEVSLEGYTVRLTRAVPGPELVRVGKLVVARPRVPREQLPELDVGQLVDQERERSPW